MRWGFFLRESWRSLSRNAMPSFAAMATVLVTMLVLGVLIPMVQATTGAANDVPLHRAIPVLNTRTPPLSGLSWHVKVPSGNALTWLRPSA